MVLDFLRSLLAMGSASITGTVAVLSSELIRKKVDPRWPHGTCRGSPDLPHLAARCTDS